MAGSRVVFVGNISYDLSEEQIIEIFSTAGRVLSFRLVLDRETGKSKGYGFCEFGDADTASSAVRNLNNFEIGGRNLRVDFAETDNMGPDASKQNRLDRNDPKRVAPANPPQPTNMNQSATDAITHILQSMNSEQLFELMSQMKTLVTNHTDQARQLLTQNPQLTFALFQALSIMKVLSPQIIQQVLANAVQQQQQIPAPMMYPPTQQPQYGYMPMQYAPPPQPQPGIPPQGYPPHQQHHMAPPAQMPPQQQSMQPPVQQPPAIDIYSLPAAQREALLQLVALPDAQIAALPYAQQQQIQMLKAAMAQPHR